MEETDKRVPLLLLGNRPPAPMSDIVLFGGANCGKSTVLHHLIVLLAGGGTRQPHLQRLYENTFKEKSKKHLKDVDIFLNFKIAEENIPVYISTDGDSWPIVEDNFRFFYHCPRKRHIIYEFNGSAFVECNILEKPFPLFCISPTNFTQFGGIQAHRYYLDLTCADWKRERWIRKYPNEAHKKSIPGYIILRVSNQDDRIAKRIILMIKQMLKEQDV